MMPQKPGHGTSIMYQSASLAALALKSWDSDPCFEENGLDAKWDEAHHWPWQHENDCYRVMSSSFFASHAAYADVLR